MSHAEGHGTVATAETQHVQGKYNIEDTEDKYAHIIGNGPREDEYDNEGKLVEQHRSNAHTLDWSGNAWFAGNVYSKPGKNADYDENYKLITKKELDEAINTLITAIKEGAY